MSFFAFYFLWKFYFYRKRCKDFASLKIAFFFIVGQIYIYIYIYRARPVHACSKNLNQKSFLNEVDEKKISIIIRFCDKKSKYKNNSGVKNPEVASSKMASHIDNHNKCLDLLQYIYM